METKEYRTIDKTGWGPGAWQNEPDKVQFTDPETKLPCLMVRNYAGAWCGYVGVAEGHPAFAKGYDDVNVDVHGGLTFSDFCQPDATEAEGICHVPGPGEPDRVWWLGFDCHHAWDYAPRIAAEMRSRRLGFTSFLAPGERDVYRDALFVAEQISRLAKQLVDYKETDGGEERVEKSSEGEEGQTTSGAGTSAESGGARADRQDQDLRAAEAGVGATDRSLGGHPRGSGS